MVLVDLWFAGKPVEIFTGLSYMGARYYDPMLGRFMGIDPKGFDPENLHSFNRYTYANNNPYRFIDPDGHSPIDVVFLAYDVGKLGVAMYTGAGVREALIDVAASVVGVASPVPGSGQAIKAARATERAVDVAKRVGSKPNGGIAKKHGSTYHDSAIDNRVSQLQQDPGVTNIRKNQQQVDVNGDKVGKNRPDIQYEKSGCHHCVEYDHVNRNSVKHGQVIRQNDPNTKVELNRL